jgi:hypothetical protein
MTMTKEQIIEKVAAFETSFNEEENIIEVDVTLVKETEEHYICNVTVIYISEEGQMEGMEITEAEYPKSIIDTM